VRFASLLVGKTFMLDTAERVFPETVPDGEDVRRPGALAVGEVGCSSSVAPAPAGIGFDSGRGGHDVANRAKLPGIPSSLGSLFPVTIRVFFGRRK